MFLDELISNLSKALRVFRVDGLMALIRIFHYKTVIALNLRLNTWPRLSNPVDGRNLEQFRLVIFAGASYDSSGGVQRASQLVYLGN